MAIETVASDILAKEEALRAYLQECGKIAIAYSGGVDSSYLASVAHEILGDNATMVLADSPSIPRSEIRDAKALAEGRGWHLVVLKTNEFEDERFLKNDGTRCFFCKTELFTQMNAFAQRSGITIMAYGEIADDRLDPTRLGAQAARQFRVVAPLAEVDLHKEEIRQLSKLRNLPTWNKASFACLSSRFPVGTPVNVEEMHKVEAAEEVLKNLGFIQYRARHHGDLCRIEVDATELTRVLEPGIHDQIIEGIQAAGYKHVTLDLQGYRTGSTAG